MAFEIRPDRGHPLLVSLGMEWSCLTAESRRLKGEAGGFCNQRLMRGGALHCPCPRYDTDDLFFGFIVFEGGELGMAKELLFL